MKLRTTKAEKKLKTCYVKLHRLNISLENIYKHIQTDIHVRQKDDNSFTCNLFYKHRGK